MNPIRVSGKTFRIKVCGLGLPIQPDHHPSQQLADRKFHHLETASQREESFGRIRLLE
jgi:hypothetical protein